MFVRNGQLKVAGEVGNLFYGKRLQTIRLYNHSATNGNDNFHPVLDYFTMESDTTAVRKGLVNPNLRDTNILAAVWDGMPVRPEDPAVFWRMI